VSYNPHLDQPVSHEGTPLARAEAAVIAVHGRDRSPEDILQVCRRIDLGQPAWLAPAAADNSWYPNSFMAPLQENEPALSCALERIDTLLDEVAGHGIKAERTVLLGFSQGACVVAEYAVRNARRYGGLMVYTGGLIGPPGTQWEFGGGFAGTPDFIGGSGEDDWVPLQRMQETAAVLRGRGAEVTEYFYQGREHVVSDREVAAARRVIANLC
jgi:predicted esterase